MAILKNKRISGKIGDFVLRQCGDKTVVARSPRRDSNRPVTRREDEIRRLFSKCVIYAKRAIRDPEIKAAYEKVALPGQSAYNLAIRDAGHAPEVLNIEAAEYSGVPGQLIIIEAIDDFTVKSVQVSIVSGDNKVIETGNAVLLTDGVHWLYKVQERNNKVNDCIITAVATDLPGNKGSFQVTLSREC